MEIFRKFAQKSKSFLNSKKNGISSKFSKNLNYFANCDQIRIISGNLTLVQIIPKKSTKWNFFEYLDQIDFFF